MPPLRGRWLVKSWFMLTPVLLDPTSTVGALPTTTISSAFRVTFSGRSWAFTWKVPPERTEMPPRL